MDDTNTNDMPVQDAPVEAPVNTTDAEADELPVDLTDEETINLFIEGLMDEKGINPESDELRQDIFNDLKTRLMQEMDRSLISALPDDKLEEFSKIAEEKGQIEPEAVAKAIDEAGVDTDEVLGVTMAKFRDIYLGKESEDTGAAEGAEE